jgi:cell division septation protein DedD
MRHRTTLVALLLIVLGFSALFSVATTADHGDENTNFTITPENRNPSATDVSHEYRVEWTDVSTGNAGMDDIDTVTVVVPEFVIEGCESGGFLGSSYSLFVDRGDSTESLSVASETWDGDAVEFELESDSPDSPFRVGHAVVLQLGGCVENAANEGWYQAAAAIEGPAVTEGQNVTLQGTSHYFGICEGCSNDTEAREELGAPPSEPTPTKTTMPTSTPTATATSTPMATQTPEPTPIVTPTSTSMPESTPTRTPESTSTDTPGPTTTSGSGGDNSENPPSASTVFGVDPLAVVGAVAVVSIALAVLGARRL